MRTILLAVSATLISFNIYAGKENGNPEIAGMPAEGKIYFSSQPFTSSATNTKTSFTSAEFIYGRMELNSGTIKEAFKIKENGNALAYLKCKVTVLQNGEEISYGNSNDYILIKDQVKNSNALNFDILPEPSKVTTVYSMLDDFSAGIGFNPISTLIMNGHWPSGVYKVHIKIYSETTNAYGDVQSEDKWPGIEDEFEFKFNEDDAEKILANKDKIKETTQENAFRYDKLPAVFSNPGKLTDPNATSAQIAAILKRDLPDRQIIKWVAETYNGPYWHIASNDLGIPQYKYFNPHIWVAYKINGKCYVGDVTLRQVYAGGGTYGQLQVAFTSAGNVPDKGIDCINVK